MTFNFGNWNWKHTWKLVLSAGVGAGSAFMAAAVAYAQAQPSSTIFAAFGSIDAAKPLLMGLLSAGAMAVLTLAEHSFIAPTPPAIGSMPGPTTLPVLRPGAMFPPDTAPAPPPTPRAPRLAWPLLFAALAACTTLPVKTAVDAAGNVCAVVVASLDPTLGPLCTTAQAVADAIAALVGAHGADAGIGAAAYKPSPAEVYAYLAGHGAAKVAQ